MLRAIITVLSGMRAATPKQKRALKELGVKTPYRLSKDAASRLLDAALEERDVSRCQRERARVLAESQLKEALLQKARVEKQLRAEGAAELVERELAELRARTEPGMNRDRHR